MIVSEGIITWLYKTSQTNKKLVAIPSRLSISPAPRIATTAIATATTITTTTSIAATAAAATITATWPVFAWFGFVARDASSCDLALIQVIHRCLSLIGIRHLHKREAS
jgi:hypothetical protein